MIVVFVQEKKEYCCFHVAAGMRLLVTGCNYSVLAERKHARVCAVRHV